MNALPILFALDSFLIFSLALAVGALIYKYKPSRLFDYLIMLILTSGISEIIKYFINKPRPESIYIFEGSGFPSTHSAVAAGIVFFYLLVCHSLPNSMKGVGEAIRTGILRKNGIINFFIILIGLTVVWLRVLLGAHYPIDVFAGIILGFLVSLVFVFYDISGKWVR
jgi:membrane-associated phospholipid phosphatase